MHGDNNKIDIFIKEVKLITIVMGTRLEGLSDLETISLMRIYIYIYTKKTKEAPILSRSAARWKNLDYSIYLHLVVLQLYPRTFLTSLLYSARVPFSDCTRRHIFDYLASSSDYQLFDSVDTDFVAKDFEDAYIGITWQEMLLVIG